MPIFTSLVQRSAISQGNFSFNFRVNFDSTDSNNLRLFFADVRVKSVQNLNVSFKMMFDLQLEIPGDILMELSDAPCLIESFKGCIGPSGIDFLRVLKNKTNHNSRVDLKFVSGCDFNLCELSAVDEISGNTIWLKTLVY